MIIGIGNDLIDIRRVEKVIAKHGDRFIQRIFTEVEIRKSERRHQRVASYAKRFAAKEACSKALGTGMNAGVFWRDMGVVNLPGTGPLMASFASYAVEKKTAKDPSRFGRGAIEGVAAPEAAANASAMTHFIPMLVLGIPAGATMALLLGALIIQGIAPGPRLMVQHPDLFWGLIASMWLGNLMLLFLNLPLVGVWIKMLQTPYRIVFPVIVIFCMIGAYSDRNEPFDLMVMAVVLAAGWVLQSLDCSPAPLIFGIILGPILEENLRRSMVLSRGDPTVFFTRPISLAFLVLTVVVILLFTLPSLTRKEKQMLAESGAEAG